MKRLFFALLCLCLFAACGDDGGDAPTEFESSYDESRALTDLSASEAESLCDEERAYADARVPRADQERVLCTTLGAIVAALSGASTDAELQAACAAGRDECLMDGVTEGTCQYSDLTADCSATVADAEACTRSQVDGVVELNQSLSCDTITMQELEELSSEESDPACDPVNACQPEEEQ